MIELRNITKTFTTGADDGTTKTFDALKQVSLTVNDGDIYGIIGKKLFDDLGKLAVGHCRNQILLQIIIELCKNICRQVFFQQSEDHGKLFGGQGG